MKTISHTYRFISLFLVVLMFITSVGFTVDMHYCTGQLKSFSLIGKAKSCHEKATTQCPHHKKMMVEHPEESLDTKNCCSNKMLHFQSDQDKQVQQNSSLLTPPFQHFISALVSTFFYEYFVTNDRSTFAHYKPPLISRDISVLTQSFLL